MTDPTNPAGSNLRAVPESPEGAMAPARPVSIIRHLRQAYGMDEEKIPSDAMEGYVAALEKHFREVLRESQLHALDLTAQLATAHEARAQIRRMMADAVAEHDAQVDDLKLRIRRLRARLGLDEPEPEPEPEPDLPPIDPPPVEPVPPTEPEPADPGAPWAIVHDRVVLREDPWAETIERWLAEAEEREIGVRVNAPDAIVLNADGMSAQEAYRRLGQSARQMAQPDAQDASTTYVIDLPEGNVGGLRLNWGGGEDAWHGDALLVFRGVGSKFVDHYLSSGETQVRQPGPLRNLDGPETILGVPAVNYSADSIVLGAGAGRVVFMDMRVTNGGHATLFASSKDVDKPIRARFIGCALTLPDSYSEGTRFQWTAQLHGCTAQFVDCYVDGDNDHHFAYTHGEPGFLGCMLRCWVRDLGGNGLQMTEDGNSEPNWGDEGRWLLHETIIENPGQHVSRVGSMVTLGGAHSGVILSNCVLLDLDPSDTPGQDSFVDGTSYGGVAVQDRGDSRKLPSGMRNSTLVMRGCVVMIRDGNRPLMDFNSGELADVRGCVALYSRQGAGTRFSSDLIAVGYWKPFGKLVWLHNNQPAQIASALRRVNLVLDQTPEGPQRLGGDWKPAWIREGQSGPRLNSAENHVIVQDEPESYALPEPVRQTPSPVGG